jgi:signal transduction histidine kinase
MQILVQQREATTLINPERPRHGSARDRRSLLSNGLKNRPVQLVAALGLLLTVLVMMVVLKEERDNRRARFMREANLYLTTLQRSIDRNVEILESVNGLFAASVEVNQKEFAAFAERAMAKHAEIQALEYVPVVKRDERESAETQARESGYKGYTVKELDGKGEMVPASPRETYFPVYFVHPLEGNEAALGFDLGSEPVRFEALSRAGESGKMNASAPITLVQETGNQYGILLFNPILRNQGNGLKGGELMGFSLGVFRITDLLNDALKGIRIRGLHFLMVDNSNPGEEVTLAYYSADMEHINVTNELPGVVERGENSWRGSLSIPGRSWSVDFYTDSHYAVTGSLLRTGLVIALVGLSFTLMVAFYMVSAARNTERAVGLVKDLKQTKSMLEGRNRDLEDFAYMVAHDLRTPLVSIHGFLELLAKSLDQVLDEQQEWIVERISANLEHFDDLLGDLLQYSRIGEASLERDKLDIREMVERITVERREEIERLGARVRVSGGLPPIYLNGSRFYQLMSNLISNGLKFGRPGTPPLVEVGMWPEPGEKVPPGHGLFYVKDNGIGVDKAMQENIFRLFFQGDKEKYDGSGAGLAIVKRIVEQDSGQIWLESSPGKGTTFFFTLPV